MNAMTTRRELLSVPLAAMLPRLLQAQAAPSGHMMLAIHQNTSAAAGYRGSLEGWARAGIEYVELSDRLLDDFLAGDTLAGARQVLTDNGLTPVSAAAVLPDIWIYGPARTESLETWRRRCDQFVELGLERIYAPSITQRPVTQADYDTTPDAIYEVGEITAAHGLTAMVEFTRTSSHLATLPTTLRAIREAGHAAVKPMLDFFHFWSGLNKFEDLNLLEPGELQHAHFQDLARRTSRTDKQRFTNHSGRRHRTGRTNHPDARRARATQGRSRSSCSARISSRRIHSKWRRRFARSARPSCANPASCSIHR